MKNLIFILGILLERNWRLLRSKYAIRIPAWAPPSALPETLSSVTTATATLLRLEALFSKRVDAMNDDTEEHSERADEEAFTYEVSDEELEAAACREGRFL